MIRICVESRKIAPALKRRGGRKSGLGVLDRACESVQDESGFADRVSYDSEPDLQCPSLYFAHNVFCLCPSNGFVRNQDMGYCVVGVAAEVADCAIVDFIDEQSESEDLCDRS